MQTGASIDDSVAQTVERASRVVEAFGYSAVYCYERTPTGGSAFNRQKKGIHILKRPKGFWACLWSPPLVGFIDFSNEPYCIKVYGNNNTHEIGDLARALGNAILKVIRVEKASDTEAKYII